MMILATVGIGLVCLLVGLLAGWLGRDARSRSREMESQSNLAALRQEAGSLSQSLNAERTASAELRQQLSTAQTQQAVLASQLESTRQNLDEQRRLLEEAQVKLRDAFSALSADALAKNNQAFLQLARENFAILSKEASGSLDQRNAQMDAQIKPLREMLGQYQQRLGDIEKSRTESYSMLREQLGTLAETQRTLNVQTNQLVTALSRPSTRGQWGEITLRRLVELSGMTRRCDFVEQTSLNGEEGKLRPDMIVNMPGNRHVIIDSKAPLEAFLDAAAAADDDTRRTCLQRHAQQVRTRCRELSLKSYWSQFANTPEFVVMFLPGEAFLYAAVEVDGSLLEDALNNQIIIATPTTLIALLKAIEFGWRQEEITQNADQIRELGSQLYDRIATLADHFDKLGRSIDGTVDAYNKFVGSMQSRVLATARKMNELGPGGQKQLADPSPVEARPRELSAL
jgi:DNA recombination protein RmuC